MSRSRRSVSQIASLSIAAFSGIWIGLAGCAPISFFESPPAPKAPASPVALPPPSPTYSKEAELIAVGDIMMHGSQIKSGYDSNSQTYSYDRFFSSVKDILAQGDWVIANLETPLAGAESGYSGYPRFNAPAALADALQAAGFNILTTANNHSLDRGAQGVVTTLENIRARGLQPVGTHATAAEAERILILEKQQIKMAILAYTYGTNGIPIPPGRDYLVALINEAKIIADIAKAKQQGADLVTVMLHFGTEYQRQPNPEQQQLVANLIKAGADIILGSHPHVVQPYEVLELTGASGSRKGAVIYSMGNFISNQRGQTKDLGVIFQVKVRKNFPEQTVEITDIKALPTWVHRYTASGSYQFRVLPLQAALAAHLAAQSDPLLTPSDYAQMQADLEAMNRHLTSLFPAAN